MGSTPLLATPRPRPPSRSTPSRCATRRSRSTRSPPPSLLLPTPRSPPTAGPLLLPTVLRRLVLFLRLPTASVVLLSRSSLTPTRLWLTSPTSTSPSLHPRGSLRVSLDS